MAKKKGGTGTENLAGLIERAVGQRGERAFWSMATREVGQVGEALAADYLRSRGYEIIERNYRCAEGEADLVAFDAARDDIVLVEVKTRRMRDGDAAERYPEEAVDARKRRRYRRIASLYVLERFPVARLRFDVIGITLTPASGMHVEHIYSLFDWDAEL